jgi:hypothetical protein
MPIILRPFRRFPVCSPQLISHDWFRGCKQFAYIIPILVLAGCFGRRPANPSPPSQQAACLSEQTNTPCFFWRESAKENVKLIIFVHGVFSTSADTWGDVKTGNTWPELVKGDKKFKDLDIYLVNYRTTYFTSAPSSYEVAKRELQRLKDKGIFNQYKEIYFVAHTYRWFGGEKSAETA